MSAELNVVFTGVKIKIPNYNLTLTFVWRSVSSELEWRNDITLLGGTIQNQLVRDSQLKMDTITESDFVSTVNDDDQIMTTERVTDKGSDREGDEEMDSRSGMPTASSGQVMGGFPPSVISSSQTSESGESSESDLSQVLEINVDPEKRCTPAQSKELHVLAEQVKIEALKLRLKSETSYYEKEMLKSMLKQSDIRVRTRK